MKKITKILAIALCLIISMSMTSKASAETNTDDRFRSYEVSGDDIDIYIDMDQLQRGNELTCSIMLVKNVETGLLISTYSTSVGKKASEIGVRKLVFQEKTAPFVWETIFADSYCDYDSYNYVGVTEYLTPEEGKTYRVMATHYAIIDGIEYSEVMMSNELTYHN